MIPVSLHCRGGHWLFELVHRLYHDDVDGAEEVAMKNGTYLCLSCLAVTDKEFWGPGRIRCPRCKQIAPAACERDLAMTRVRELASLVEVRTALDSFIDRVFYN